MAAEPQTPEATKDPIGYFLEDQEYHGKSERTIEAYERVLRRFESFVANELGVPTDSLSLGTDVSRRQCMSWVHSLRARLEASSIATYASYVHRFYDYMSQIGVFDSNPMALVIEEMDESIDTNPTRRELTVEQMQSFIGDIDHPLDRAAIVTLLKTGMRVGELCNLDLRDINCSFDRIELDSQCRVQLEGREDSVYVPAEPTRGKSYNDEVRSASNKRKRETIIPIDAELQEVLENWLAIRPDTASPADPLFIDTRDSWGQRLQPADVRYIVEKHARQRDWYRTGGGAAVNVTPHYFRHFFTTHLRDRTGDRGVVKYLRGDVANDVIDTYTHNWGDQVHTVYHRNIYSLT